MFAASLRAGTIAATAGQRSGEWEKAARSVIAQRQNPPRVTLFVNEPKLSTPTHQAFLTARLREAFDLAGVPLVLRYRSSHGEKEAGAP